MCTQNTTNTMRTDARRQVCAAMVPYRWATRGTSLRELEYTHTGTVKIYIVVHGRWQYLNKFEINKMLFQPAFYQWNVLSLWTKTKWSIKHVHNYRKKQVLRCLHYPHPAGFSCFKSSIKRNSTSHSGETPAKHISFQSSNTYLQKNNCHIGS